MIANTRRPILVTGGAGFIGCNIADRLAREGHEVILFDALSRPGVERNLQWLKDRHDGRIASVIADVRDEDEVARAVAAAGAVFHMAAQVAVTTSLADPREDFDINIRGTLNVLDAVRLRREPIPVIFASTNKVYGDLGDLAIVTRGDRYEPEGLFAQAAGFSYALRLLEGRGRPVRARLCAKLRHPERGVPDELHLRPAADGDRGPGVGCAFPDPRPWA
jgi:CDP-paratose 2-epimerase